MKNVFLFFRHEDAADPGLERDFRGAYQEPSLGYLQLAFVLGIIGFAGFLVMDLVHGTVAAFPGVSAARISVCLIYLLGLAATTFYRQFVARHYTPIVNFFMSLGMLGAALLPIAIHGNSSNLDIYWSLNSSLTTGAIVIYGTSRLTARNTALIVLTGCLMGIATVLRLPTFDWYPFGRLVFHLIFVNLAAFSLRETVERHERSLFLLARENLSRNVYARELELANAQAQEGNDIKMRFLANMSHEFRTPMNGVLQTLELAGRSASSELAGLIEKARKSGFALLATLTSILEYTRWTRQGLTPERTPVSLSDSIRRVVLRHEKAAAEHGLDLALRLDLMRSEDVMLVDGPMVEEVVTRLLDNAIRFTREGRIGIGVELVRRADLPYPAATLEVSVVDTGVGIPEDSQNAIYKPFFQVDDASDRKVGGTGLGLAIVQRLVDAMEGQISLTSAVGVGSTFRVCIPVEICTSSSSPGLGSRSMSPGKHLAASDESLSGSVLLAEDNELNAALVAELLSLMGLTVTLAMDGAQALREAESCRFDIILMDCQMPNMDGYESTRRIRSSEQAHARFPVPIIAVTANALSGDREKCLAAGMDDYLAKPYTAAQLRSKLRAWLPQPHDAPSTSEGTRPPGAQVRTVES